MSTVSTQLAQMNRQSLEAHFATITAFIATLQSLNDQLEPIVGWADITLNHDQQTRGRSHLATAQGSLAICGIIAESNALRANTMNTAQKQRLEELMDTVGELEAELIDLVDELETIFRNAGVVE